jgi:hypothetical protein
MQRREAAAIQATQFPQLLSLYRQNGAASKKLNEILNYCAAVCGMMKVQVVAGG